MTTNDPRPSSAARLRRALTGVGVALVLVGATPATAAADDESAKISTRVTDKGVVVAQVKVAAKADAVRELLAKAERSHSLAPTTVEAKATPDGKCERVKLQTRGLLSPFKLETRRCPTASGWRETLVASDDFAEYWNEWTVQDLGDGAMVSFKTRTLPNVAVAESLVLLETKRVLAKLMRNLLAALNEG